MPFLYNVHTPAKTFALAYKEGESFDSLVERITKKAGSSQDEARAVKQGKDGAGVVYEFEAGRWSLEDDDDLEILYTRYPPTSTPSATLHLALPHAHARFAQPPATSTAASALKNKTQGQSQSHSSTAGTGTTRKPSVKLGKAVNGTGEEKTKASPKANGTPELSSLSISAPSHHFPSASHAGNTVKEASTLGKPAAGEKVEVVGHTHGRRSASASGQQSAGATLAVPGASRARSTGAPSVRSTTSRRSKWGDNDAEPMWEVQKRAWHEFHNGTGVRTVMGKVGDVDNVRMLLKPGYKGVYVSRSFAVRSKLVAKHYGMGHSGYTGLCSLGKVAITVAGKTAVHQAMISEEAHFDVVLGRQWVERMNVKIDPNDQTILTYMETGDSIPCDVVVLKDAQGNKIHLT